MLGKHLNDEQRRKVSEARRGRPLSTEHRAKISAYHRGRAKSPETRARMSDTFAVRGLTGKRYVSALESRAAKLLIPLGFRHYGKRIGAHRPDFTRDDCVVEVNGCYFHKHDCGITAKWIDPAKDERVREIVRSAGLKLIELWECQEADWPRQIALNISHLRAA